MLGKCYDALGRKLEAVSEFREVLRVAPDNAAVKDLLRRLKDRDAEGHRPDHVREYASRIPLGKNSPEEHLVPLRGSRGIVSATLAEIYATQGQYSEAITMYKKLKDEHVGVAPRYEQRIAELEELEKIKLATKESADGLIEGKAEAHVQRSNSGEQ